MGIPINRRKRSNYYIYGNIGMEKIFIHSDIHGWIVWCTVCDCDVKLEGMIHNVRENHHDGGGIRGCE